MSINYSSPIELGGLNTADPLDGRVQSWWRERRPRYMSIYLTLAVSSSRLTLNSARVRSLTGGTMRKARICWLPHSSRTADW